MQMLSRKRDSGAAVQEVIEFIIGKRKNNRTNGYKGLRDN